MKRRRFSAAEKESIIELLKVILEPSYPALNKLIRRIIIIYVSLMMMLMIAAIISKYI